MTKTLSMVRRKIYNLNANEGFVIFLTSKLITGFIDGFTLEMKSQSIAYLLNGSEHIYWIWDLEGEVHSIWDLCVSGLQECKGTDFFEVRQTGSSFRAGTIKSHGRLPLTKYPPPRKVCGGYLTSSLRTFGGVRSGRGQPSRDFLSPTENCCPPRPTSKKTLPLHS